MNKDQPDIERITKGLLKKSLLTPSSPDFDDLLIKKIQNTPFQLKQNVANNPVKKAWQFLILAVFLFIGSLFILDFYSDMYFSDVSRLFEVYSSLHFIWRFGPFHPPGIIPI